MYKFNANVVLASGTNDLRPTEHPDVNSLIDLQVNKIRQIRKLNPRSTIVVMPVLPTRDPEMNTNIMKFNRSMRAWLCERCDDTNVIMPTLMEFIDRDGLLRSSLLRNPGDPIHIGPNGVSRYVRILKEAVYAKQQELRAEFGYPRKAKAGFRPRKPA